MTGFIMTPFFEEPVLLRSLMGFWSLLLCLVGAGNVTLSLGQKKRRFFMGILPCLLVGAFLLRVVHVASGAGMEWNGNGRENLLENMTRKALQWRGGGWILLLLGMTVLACWITWNNLRWQRTHVTPFSIQEGFERLTEGLCYYRKGGQCVLVNSRMNALCMEISGHPLMNGEEFARELPPVLTTPRGETFLITQKDVLFGKEMIKEIVASNVTEYYQKTQLLEEETKRLQSFQEELRKYHVGMRENVRKEEILRAKMNIHDEMNRVLLSTRQAMMSDDPAEREKALLSWKKNALLLCKESEGSTGTEDAMRDLQVIADSLGVQLVLKGNPAVMSEEALGLFVVITREAMNNAVKHADAKHVCAEISSMDQERVRIVYYNDGRKPEPGMTVKETGGLKNMRQKLEEIGGNVKIQVDEGFRLEAEIPAGTVC